jgi:hypothetical protein|tara:strand:+ start:77 stop:223 length:147 start_codon:yes stop_codon:yes gene_type:complete
MSDELDDFTAQLNTGNDQPVAQKPQGQPPQGGPPRGAPGGPPPQMTPQ